MIKPAYKLTIGNQIVDTTDEPKASTLVSLHVESNIDAVNNQFKLVLGNVGHFKPEREDDAVIELGYTDEENSLEQVMSGNVNQVNQGSTLDKLLGYSAAATLLRSFKDQTFESKSAGDIVRDLAGDASVNIRSADSGIHFPAYVIDSCKSYFHHIKDLAELCGFDFYINSDNEIVFKKFVSGNLIHVFEHAKHILQLNVEHTLALAGKVEAWGESGTTQGTESWAWLTKDFSALKGSSGFESPTKRLQDSALRTRQAAQTAADARVNEIQRRTIRGELLSMGRPQVKLGDAIRITGLPEDELNQTYQVRGVVHQINKQMGFMTKVKFSSIAGLI